MTIKRGAIALLVCGMPMAAAAAQTAQPEPVRGLESLQPQANAQEPTAIPIPSAPTIVLPSSRTPPASVADRPRAARPGSRPAPRVEPRTTAPDSAPPRTVEMPPTAVPAETPAATATPTIAPDPVVPAPVVPAPVVRAATQPAPTVTAPETGRAMPFWLWLLVIVVVVAALWALRRRRPELPAEPAAPSAPVAGPVPQPEAPPIVAAPDAPQFLEPAPIAAATPARARLTMDLRPKRAGVNILSATAECEIVVTNIGDVAAQGIRLGASLLTAHAGQDADLMAVNAAPILRPATPPFALAPGESRTVRAVVATPRNAIHALTAANRPMFVPIVAVNLLYASGAGEGQAARAWAIGIERVDSAKLAPFWLDSPARMYDTIAARPHAAAFER